MKNKLPILLILTVYLLGIYYLILPVPTLPSLTDSVVSDEPGDTWQHPDQIAFYTNRDNRQDILDELQNKFSLPGLAKIINYRLNYRPEDTQDLVRDPLKSYYLEEVVHPFRESLFINVLDPEKSPLIRDEDRAQQRMYFHGQFYPIKVTLKPIYAGLWARLLVWTLIFPTSLAVFLSLKKSFSKLSS